MVPAGIEIELKSGQSGFITQALGGSFTLYMEGNLFRLAGSDADAIGKEVVKAPELPPNCHRRRRAGAGLGPAAHLLRPGDPDQHRGPRAYLRVHGERATLTAAASISVRLTLTAPGCGMGDVLVQDIKTEAGNHPDGGARPTSSWCSIRRGINR